MLILALEDVLVPVAEDASTGDMPSSGQPHVSLVHPLRGLHAMVLVREALNHGHQRTDRISRSQAPILQIAPHLDTCHRQLFDDAAGLEHLPADGLLLADDEDLEGCLWLQHGHHAAEPWTLRELGSAEAVVFEHVLVADSPASPRGKRTRVLDLSRD